MSLCQGVAIEFYSTFPISVAATAVTTVFSLRLTASGENCFWFVASCVFSFWGLFFLLKKDKKLLKKISLWWGGFEPLPSHIYSYDQWVFFNQYLELLDHGFFIAQSWYSPVLWTEPPILLSFVEPILRVWRNWRGKVSILDLYRRPGRWNEDKIRYQILSIFVSFSNCNSSLLLGVQY